MDQLRLGQHLPPKAYHIVLRHLAHQSARGEHFRKRSSALFAATRAFGSTDGVRLAGSE